MVDSDDKNLFRRVIGDVRPVEDHRDRSRPAAAKPGARQTEADEALVMSELLLHGPDHLDTECGEELGWRHPGLQTGVMKRLKRGRYAVADELDLHTMRLPVAEQAIIGFIAESRAQGYSCVRIIHGKGLRSRGQPVLKKLTAKLLRRMPGVLAFCSARQVDGGTGAVYVLLQR